MFYITKAAVKKQQIVENREHVLILGFASFLILEFRVC
jgi:hypothetical protein